MGGDVRAVQQTETRSPVVRVFAYVCVCEAAFILHNYVHSVRVGACVCVRGGGWGGVRGTPGGTYLLQNLTVLVRTHVCPILQHITEAEEVKLLSRIKQNRMIYILLLQKLLLSFPSAPESNPSLAAACICAPAAPPHLIHHD